MRVALVRSPGFTCVRATGFSAVLLVKAFLNEEVRILQEFKI